MSESTGRLSALETFRSLPAVWPNIPGYTVVRVIGEGGAGRVFEVNAPGGFAKAIKLVNLDRHNPLTERELEGLRLIRTIRHPYLVSIDRLDVEAERITIVMELADGNLREAFLRETALGRSGIGRMKLLGWLREAAEAIDLLNLKYKIQHLDVKPENLFLFSDHLKVGDYGLIRETTDVAIDSKSNAVTPAYAAPELFDGSISAASDQYSLAVVYVEMLTGQRPFKTGSARQLALYHLTRPADVGLLPPADRSLVAKALSRNPKDRFESCSAFINALTANPQTEYAPTASKLETMADVSVSVNTVSVKSAMLAQRAKLSAGEATTIEDLDRNITDSKALRCVAQLSIDDVRARLRAMASDWNAEWLDFRPHFVALRFETRSSWFRHQVGMRDLLFLAVRLFPRLKSAGVAMEATVSHHGYQVSPETFEQYSQGIFEGMTHAISAAAAGENCRRDERRAIHCPLTIIPTSGPVRNLPVPCTGVDCSTSGMALVSMMPLDPVEVRVRLPGRTELLRARVIRCEPDVLERRFHIGLRFAPETQLSNEYVAGLPSKS